MYSVCLVDYNGTPASDTPTVVSNELYIYDPVTNDEGLVVIDPMLSLEVSKAGSFSCSLPQTNYGFGRIIDKVTRLVVRKNNKIIFIGRINSEDRDLYLTQKIIAEGALAYLNDSLTEKKTIVAKNPDLTQKPNDTTTRLGDLLYDIFNNHNGKFAGKGYEIFHFAREELIVNNELVGYNYPNCHAEFVGYNSKDVNSNELTQLNLNFDTSLSIVESLLDSANAMLNIEWDDTNNYWEVYIYNKYDTGVNSSIPRTTQPIEFGLNLLDLTQSYDRTDIVTAVAPFGGDLIQESKEIGDIVASNDVKTYITGGSDPNYDVYDHILIRDTDNYDYFVYGVGGDPVYEGQGYWAFEFDIEAYNNAHTDKLKKLYLSWRSYKFPTVDSQGDPTGYICDNAWRIYQRIVEIIDGQEVVTYQTLGFHELTNDNEAFESAINEEIDLTDAQYKDATHIRIGGWGGLVTPLIRRDALVVEEADKLNISKCKEFEETDLMHEEGSFYLKSKNLINTYGLIEKKLEFDIEDKNEPKTEYVAPHSDYQGSSTLYENYALGYKIRYDDEQNQDLERNKGNYRIIPFSGYSCIEFELPNLTNINRPRGIFITSRMHDDGNIVYNFDGDDWYMNGMYVFLDESKQVLAYKAAAKSEKGFGFTSIRREFIDLTEAQYYGAKWVRVGSYTGGGYGIECMPSDDNKPRNRLMEQAKLYLTSYQWDKIVIEAQAIDLSLTSNEWEALDICKLTEVNSSFHGATFWKPITSLELNLNNFEDNSIKLGYDNDEYMSNQLNESLRLSAIERAIEERRNST